MKFKEECKKCAKEYVDVMKIKDVGLYSHNYDVWCMWNNTLKECGEGFLEMIDDMEKQLIVNVKSYDNGDEFVEIIKKRFEVEMKDEIKEGLEMLK